MNLRYVSNIPRLVAAWTYMRYLWKRYMKWSRRLVMDVHYDSDIPFWRYATILYQNVWAHLQESMESNSGNQILNNHASENLWICLLQFQTRNSKTLDIQVSYLNNQISSNSNVSFLGLKIDNFLTWKDHIDTLVAKLNRSCFAIRSVKSILSLETLKIVYYSYVHSILNYGIIFWGNSSYSIRIFRIQ
jgi:hypothetical protein